MSDSNFYIGFPVAVYSFSCGIVLRILNLLFFIFRVSRLGTLENSKLFI